MLISPPNKYRIKRVISALGIRVRPGAKPRADLRGFLVHVRSLGFSPATVIDVGVADGTIELYSTFPGAFHLLVEPAREFEGALQFICRHYNAAYVIAAATDEDGEATLRCTSDLHGASTIEDTGASAQPRFSRVVPAFTLDTLAEEHSTRGPYLIKADTQGTELTVLDGAKRLLAETEIVVLEVSLFRFGASAPVLDEVISYMKTRGFVVYDVFGGHGRPLDGALAQVDIAFVKEAGQFRASHLYYSEEQARAYNNSLVCRIRKRLNV